VPGPPADFSPFVRGVLDKKPNAMITSTNFQTAPGFTAALRAAGYTGFNMNFVAYVPGLLKASAQLAQALNGAYVNSQIVPQEEQTEYVKQVEDDLVAISAKNGKFILFGAAIAYEQADLLVQQLEAVGKGLDTKNFDEKINGGAFVSKSAKAGGPGSLAWPGAHFLPAD